MKIALVHDALYTYGGGERVLELFHEIFPDAPIYTLFYDNEAMPASFRSLSIKQSAFRRLPFHNRLKKYYTPIMPSFLESFDLSAYDVVISICSAFSKGVLTPVSTCHISYTLTVPRFLWGYETSTQKHHPKNVFLPFVNNYLRLWDKAASDRVDYFLANSETVKRRIKKAYHRNASVIYSPVDEDIFTLSTIRREDFYLVVSRMDSYKRIDLAIEACNLLERKLIIIGNGPERERLERLAKGKVDFLGSVPDEILLRYYRSAKGVIFPGADDLGLVPIEAQMCGTPVIALNKDGARETVVDGVTGRLFKEQSVESLVEGIKMFESTSFDIEKIREITLKFSKSKIKKELKHFILEAHKQYQESYKLYT